MPAKLISERKTNLALSYQELLTATVRLRFNRQSAPKPDVFRAHMHEAYRLSTLEAENNGYQPEYVRMAGQAVIAFLDETVAVSGNTAFSGWWISPLTQELFPNAPADAFYRDLENLLSTRDSPEVGDTLEVLYLCLLLGYRGALKDGSEELSDFLDKISAKMLHVRGVRESLVPDWGVPPELIEPLPAGGARRMAITAIALSLAICVAAIVIGKLSLLAGASTIHSLIK
jgi:type IV/VI secretion system ImpK/VasF family protein